MSVYPEYYERDDAEEGEYDERDERIDELQSALELAHSQNVLLAMGQHIHVEGNQGGDYLDIKLVKDNAIRLEVANSGIVTIRHEIPVEFLTALLSDMVARVMSHRSTTEALQGLIGVVWGQMQGNEEWIRELQQQVRKVD